MITYNEWLNKAAMEAVGDLQLSSPEDYFEITKRKLQDAYRKGMEDSAEIIREQARTDIEAEYLKNCILKVRDSLTI